jgi:hypothetical protein
LLLASCASKRAAQEDESTEIVVVQRGSLETSITALGNIRPGAEVVLSFEGTGQVHELLVQSGERPSGATSRSPAWTPRDWSSKCAAQRPRWPRHKLNWHR